VDEAGEPLPNASVRLVDVFNQGLGLEWSTKTDSDGRFNWRGAPTNELGLFIVTRELNQLVRLRASTNEHRIVLHSGSRDTNHVAGTVTDAATGKPIERFTVKVSHDTTSGRIAGTSRAVDGVEGKFELTTAKSEIAVGNYPFWMLLIEADGYDPLTTRQYEFEEGDQQLEFQLTPGGFVEGTLFTPEGEPAARCDVAVTTANDSARSWNPGQLLAGSDGALTKTDANGHFKIKRPVYALMIAAFHPSGWVAVPVPTNLPDTRLQLEPWACIE